MSAPSATVSRYHALDALRAAMMFLGIYLHAVVAYSPIGGWPYKPLQLTTALDWSTGLTHVFRMPIFYVMAGFFTALLLQRYGFRRSVGNRFWRVGEVELDRPPTACLEVDESRPVLRRQEVARVRLAVQQLLGGAAVADRSSQAS